MKPSRFTEEQIIGILREQEAGAKTIDVCRKVRRPREAHRHRSRRIHVDKGYRGHNHPHRHRVWISGQVRRVTKAIRREMRRRAAIEPVIGHLQSDHRMGRNYLTGHAGDRANAVLAAAGYNFSLLLR